VSTVSGIYEGTLRHRRFEVTPREFTHRLALAYIDLDELPVLLDGRLLRRAPGLLRFRRRDYLGPCELPLAEAVRSAVGAQAGGNVGPIRVLTQLRSFETCFNPVSFYYCFEPGGERLAAIVAEVTNTPWGERQRYVLPAARDNSVVEGVFKKEMHVSPFMAMDQRYVWRLAAPGETLSVHIENHDRDGALAFDATLAMRRSELTPCSARALTRRYPLASVRVLALIYGHALGLKLAGVPVHGHPSEVSGR
jgi:uncharacterized protein